MLKVKTYNTQFGVVDLVKMKSPEETTKKYVMGSIECFMRGEKNLKWIVGVIRSSGLRKEVLKNLFSIYGKAWAGKSSFQELEKKCKELGYI